MVNVEFGEDIFNVEKSRILADTLYDDKEMRVKRKTKLRQFMRGLAVVMDSAALPVANDSIASHIEYIKEERKNRELAEAKGSNNRIVNITIIGAGIIAAIIASTAGG